MFTKAEQHNYRVKIKNMKAEVTNLKGEFEPLDKMLKDGKAHANMLESYLKKRRAQVQQVRSTFEGFLYELRLRRKEAEAATGKVQAEIYSVTMALVDQSKTFNTRIAGLEDELKVKTVELS